MIRTVIWAFVPPPRAGPVQTKLGGTSALPGSWASGATAPGGTEKVTPWKVRDSQPAGTGAGAAGVEAFPADGAATVPPAVALASDAPGAAGRLGAASDGVTREALAPAW